MGKLVVVHEFVWKVLLQLVPLVLHQIIAGPRYLVPLPDARTQLFFNLVRYYLFLPSSSTCMILLPSYKHTYGYATHHTSAYLPGMPGPC